VEGRRSWWPCVRWLPQSTHGRASVCGTFGASIRRLWNRRRPFIGAPAFGIPPAEASRDDRSDGPHARLPADIFRLPSSWVHWGEIAESAGSRPGLHDFSLCSDEEDEGPPAHGQESGASTAWTLSSYRSGWKVAWRSRVQLPEQFFGEAARSRFRPATRRRNRLLTNPNPRRGSQLPAEEEITDERIDELG
jgi:hypothetical protein